MNPITLKRWLVTPERQRCTGVGGWGGLFRRLMLHLCPTAGDSGELSQQPLSQLPPLLLREPDDVRHDSPLQPAGQVQAHATVM